MVVRRVYVIWAHPLFHESARLLLKDPGIFWVGSTSDLAEAREEIRRLQPETILIERTGNTLPFQAIGFLEGKKEVRVIGCSLDNNQISLYHRECHVVTKVEDLLQIVIG